MTSTPADTRRTRAFSAAWCCRLAVIGVVFALCLLTTGAAERSPHSGRSTLDDGTPARLVSLLAVERSTNPTSRERDPRRGLDQHVLLIDDAHPVPATEGDWVFADPTQRDSIQRLASAARPRGPPA